MIRFPPAVRKLSVERWTSGAERRALNVLNPQELIFNSRAIVVNWRG